MLSAFMVLLVMVITLRSTVTCCNNEPEKEKKKEELTLEQIETLFTDHYETIKKFIDGENKLIKGTINTVQDNLKIKIADNRKLIEKSIETCNENHQRVMQELSGLSHKVQSIIDVVIHDQDKTMLGDKNIDEFMGQLEKFTEHAESIDGLYKQFMEIYRNPLPFSKRTIQNFIDSCFGYTKFEMRPTLQKMLNGLIGERGIFYLMANEPVERYVLATRRMSTLEYLAKLSLYVASAETRCSLMATAAQGMVLVLKTGDSYERDYEVYLKGMAERLTVLVQSIKLYVKTYSGRFYLFDTEKYRIGHRYVYFSDIFKGIYFRDNWCVNVGRKVVVKGSQK